MIGNGIALLLAIVLVVSASGCGDDSTGDSAPSAFEELGLPTPSETETKQLTDGLTTAFGDEVFGGFGAAEARFGWKPMCSTDKTLQNPLHGLVEVEEPSNLPRLRLLYNESTSHTPMVFIQQPDTYELPPEVAASPPQPINGLNVQVWEEGPRAGAVFPTGEQVDGHLIYGTVSGRDFGLDRIRDFVKSLTFDCT